MLAIASSDALSIIDQPTLKKTPSSFPSCLTLLSPPIASSWSPDNRFLYIASADTLHKYDSELNSLVDLFASEDRITSLVVKDKASLVFSAGEKVHILETATAKISQTLNVHQQSINSLSLSNDCTLLASTSSNEAYVSNLTLASHTTLHGLPVSDRLSITTCTFHPHTRTRLLLGLGKQLVIYDTTRPAAPIKVVSLNEATASGNITAISCSPFSKTLVSVATSGGTLGLIDLDKEKGLFRTINVKVPLSSLSFSQEGASIYLGTENGKLLILDLRALDKPPKAVVLSEVGARMATMSVQSKAKTASVPDVSKPATVTSRKPSVNKPSSSPATARRVASASLKGKGPTGTDILKASLGKEKDKGSVKKVFSPPRDPLGVSNTNGRNANANDKDDDFSLQIETLNGLRPSALKKASSPDPKSTPKSTPVKEKAERLRERTLAALSNSTSRAREGASVSARLRPGPSQPSPSPSSASASASIVVPRRTRTVSSTSRITAISSPLSASAKKNQTAKNEPAAVAQDVSRRARKVSTTSRAGKNSVGVADSISAASVTGSTRTDRDRLTAKKSFLSPASASVHNRSSASARTRTVSSSLTSRPMQSQPSASTKTTTTKTTSASVKTAVSSPSQRHPRTPSPDLSDIEPLTARPDPVPVTPVRTAAGPGTTGEPNDDDASGDEGADAEDEGGAASFLDVQGDKDKFRENAAKGKKKGKSRTVLFRDYESEDSGDESESGKENQPDGEEIREESLSMQISPRRLPPSSASGSAFAFMPWGNSPVRHTQSHSHLNAQYGANLPGSPNGSSPQNLLRSIIRDIMYDFHQETRADMTGLHLDLVRMGRGWKREMKELRELVEGKGEMEVLREENKRLREENEKLRRGY